LNPVVLENLRPSEISLLKRELPAPASHPLLSAPPALDHKRRSLVLYLYDDFDLVCSPRPQIASHDA
jgi:hypothetical protein